MAKIASKTYWWSPVDAPDLAGYKVYTVPGNETPTYNHPSADVGLVEPDEDGKCRADLALVTPQGTEGVYDLYVTSYDREGNESHFGAFVDDVALDFTPPPAPAGGGIES